METCRQIKSNNPYHFRTGQWACIYDEKVINGRKQWLVGWPDWVYDYWLCEDPEAHYEFRDCEILKGEHRDTQPETRTPSEDSPVG